MQTSSLGPGFCAPRAARATVRAMSETPRKRGRPPGGPHGQRVRDLPRRSLRWPAAAEARLQAWAWHDPEGRTAWALLELAVNAALDNPKLVPSDVRARVVRDARTRVSRIRARTGSE